MCPHKKAVAYLSPYPKWWSITCMDGSQQIKIAAYDSWVTKNAIITFVS